MSHSFNLECENCGQKYCECHEEETLDFCGDQKGFCSESCKDEWIENLNDDDKKDLERYNRSEGHNETI